MSKVTQDVRRGFLGCGNGMCKSMCANLFVILLGFSLLGKINDIYWKMLIGFVHLRILTVTQSGENFRVYIYHLCRRFHLDKLLVLFGSIRWHPLVTQTATTNTNTETTPQHLANCRVTPSHSLTRQTLPLRSPTSRLVAEPTIREAFSPQMVLWDSARAPSRSAPKSARSQVTVTRSPTAWSHSRPPPTHPPTWTLALIPPIPPRLLAPPTLCWPTPPSSLTLITPPTIMSQWPESVWTEWIWVC